MILSLFSVFILNHIPRTQSAAARRQKLSRIFLRSATPNLRFGTNSGALMVDNFPAVGCSPPDCRPACNSHTLMKRVSNQEIIRCNLQAVESVCLPGSFLGLRYPGIKRLQDELSAIAATRSADFPVRVVGHVFEIPAGCAKFGLMEYRLSAL